MPSGLKPILIIFVKAPRPGHVKTRLAASLGLAAACSAYGKLVATLAENLRSLAQVELRITPDDAGDELQQRLGSKGWKLRPQGAGDLGTRLTSAFAEAFAGGSTAVSVIGSDCPYLTTEDIRASWEGTTDHDVVLGPADDGGYWLIALRSPQPGLFNGIHWGTDRVLEQTLARTRELKLKVQMLRALEDVDTETAWRRFEAWKNQRIRAGTEAS